MPERGIYNFDPGAFFGIYRPDTFWLDESQAQASAERTLMLQYLLRRLLTMATTLVAISILVFIIIQLPPGDYLTS